MIEQKQQIYTELLVIRCQQGQKAAFELIVELWQKRLLVFALRYLDQETDAWDAVQETWVAVIKGLNKLQRPSLFVSWLFRILTYKCIDRIRKKQAEKQLLQNTEVKPEPLPIPHEDECLSQAIDELSDEHRAIVMLRFGQGLKIGEIAAILNTAEGTIKSRLHRALARLRKILGEKP